MKLGQIQKEEIALVLAKMTEVVEQLGPQTKYTDLYPGSYDEVLGIPKCHYVIDAQPACLIGRVLALLGWSIDQLAGLHNITCSVLATPSSEQLAKATWQVLAQAQIAQDADLPWGQALEKARTLGNGLILGI